MSVRWSRDAVATPLAQCYRQPEMTQLFGNRASQVVKQALLVLCLLALALAPNGLMPVRGDDGTITLVICTADGPVEQVVDLGTGERSENQPENAAPNYCSYAPKSAAIAALQGATKGSLITYPAEAPASVGQRLFTQIDRTGTSARGPPTIT